MASADARRKSRYIGMDIERYVCVDCGNERHNRMTEAQVIERIRKEADRAGSLRALAREWGVTHNYLSFVTRGIQPPGPTVLKKLGLRRVKTVRYEPAGR